MVSPRVGVGHPPRFWELGEHPFQYLSCDLMNAEAGTCSASVYGVRGQSQKGVDIVAHRVDGRLHVAQAKCYEKADVALVRDASEEFLRHWGFWSTQRIEKFTLFIACPCQRTELLDEVRRQEDEFRTRGIVYELCDSVGLKNRLRSNPAIVAEYLPEWGHIICGTPPPVSTLRAEAARLKIVEDTLASTLAAVAQKLCQEMERGLSAARDLMRKGDTVAALAWVKQLKGDTRVFAALSRDLQCRILCLEGSLRLGRRGSPSAEELLGQAESLDCNDATRRLHALIARQRRDYGAALNWLSDPTDPDGICLRAAILMERGRLQDAEEALRTTLEGNPPPPDALRLQALIHAARGQIPQARVRIAQALEVAPNWHGVRSAVGVVGYLTSICPAALPGGILACPAPLPWNLVKRDDESVKALRESEGHFERLAREAMDRRECLRWMRWRLACLSNNPDTLDEATDLAKTVLTETPGDNVCLSWVVGRNLSVDLGPQVAALRDRVRGRKAGPGDFVALVTCYLSASRTREALEVLQASAQLFTSKRLGTLWAAMHAQCLVAEGSLRSARECLVGRRTPHGDLYVVRAQCRATGDWTQVSEYCRKHARSRDMLLQLEMCEAMAEASKWEFVAQRAEDLLSSFPNPSTVQLAAWALYNQGRHEECLRVLDGYRKLFPGSRLSSSLTRLRSTVLFALGVLSEAIASAEAVVQADPSTHNLLNLAGLYAGVGDLEALTRVARQLRGRLELQAAQLFQLSWWVRFRDLKLAAEFWRKAVHSADFADDMVPEAFRLALELGLDTETKDLSIRLQRLGKEGHAGIRELATDQIPDVLREQHKQTEELLELYQQANLPIHALSGALKPALPLLFLKTLLLNAQGDRRSFAPVLARFGRKPAGQQVLSEEGQPLRILADITALMMASFLGIMDEVVVAFGPITIPGEVVSAVV